MPLNAKHYIQSRYLQIAAGLAICLLGVNTLQRARLPQRPLEALGLQGGFRAVHRAVVCPQDSPESVFHASTTGYLRFPCCDTTALCNY